MLEDYNMYFGGLIHCIEGILVCATYAAGPTALRTGGGIVSCSSTEYTAPSLRFLINTSKSMSLEHKSPTDR